MNLQLVNQELFNGITCDVWRNDNHEIFMTTEQLAQCIGYQTRYGITKLVQKNKYLKNREFSVSAKLAHGDGKQYDTRVFTFEGIKEILFLAPKSETARKFREWTRSVLNAYFKGELVKANNMNRMKSEQNKFYHTKQWRSIREIALRRDSYLCQYCLNHKRVKTGNIGDHIVPYEVEPENRTNLANIAIACSKCHTAKTKWEQLYYGTGAGNTLKRVIPIRNVKDLPDFQKK